MKQISVRQFQINPTDALSDLPIALTRYGRVVAIVNGPEKDGKIQEVIDKLNKMPKKVGGMVSPEKRVIEYPEGHLPPIGPVGPPVLVKFTLNRVWGIRLCPHQNESGQCPMGCVDSEEVK